MSTGLELVPIALAIGTVVAARRRERGSVRTQTGGSPVQTFGTRMRDPDLLAAAVGRAGGRMLGERDGMLYGAVGKTALVFAADDAGVFEVHVDAGLPADHARGVVDTVDRSYGIEVQQRTYHRVTERAAGHGLALESEYVDEDDSIVLCLRVGAIR